MHSGYQSLTVSAKLTIDDLRDVKKALWPARNKWRDIGTEIGEDENSLESIDMTNRKPEDCLREMLGGWLRGAYNPNQKNSKPRTWRTLIDALREKEIGLTDLANNIEKEKYGISVPGKQLASNKCAYTSLPHCPHHLCYRIRPSSYYYETILLQLLQSVHMLLPIHFHLILSLGHSRSQVVTRFLIWSGLPRPPRWHAGRRVLSICHYVS